MALEQCFSTFFAVTSPFESMQNLEAPQSYQSPPFNSRVPSIPAFTLESSVISPPLQKSHQSTSSSEFSVSLPLSHQNSQWTPTHPFTTETLVPNPLVHQGCPSITSLSLATLCTLESSVPPFHIRVLSPPTHPFTSESSFSFPYHIRVPAVLANFLSS